MVGNTTLLRPPVIAGLLAWPGFLYGCIVCVCVVCVYGVCMCACVCVACLCVVCVVWVCVLCVCGVCTYRVHKKEHKCLVLRVHGRYQEQNSCVHDWCITTHTHVSIAHRQSPPGVLHCPLPWRSSAWFATLHNAPTSRPLQEGQGTHAGGSSKLRRRDCRFYRVVLGYCLMVACTKCVVGGYTGNCATYRVLKR